MARKTPLVNQNVLAVHDLENDRLIYSLDITQPAEWKYWQDFLANNKSFRYKWTNKQGFIFSFSAYKEKQPNGHFWIAQKRVNKKLRRVYLGKNSNLTAKKLQETALKICQGKLPTS